MSLSSKQNRIFISVANKAGAASAAPLSAQLSKPLLNIKNSVMAKEENAKKPIMNGR